MRRRRSLLFPRVNLAIFAPSRTPCSRRIRTQRSYSAGPPEPKRPESFRVQPAAVDDAPTAAAQALQIHKQPNAGSKSRKGVPIEAGKKGFRRFRNKPAIILRFRELVRHRPPGPFRGKTKKGAKITVPHSLTGRTPPSQSCVNTNSSVKTE